MIRFHPESTDFQPETVAERRRAFGIDDSQPTQMLGLGRSMLLDILQERAVEVPAVFEPNAEIVYFDFELAMALGIIGRDETAMTDALHARLLEALSWRVLAKGADPKGQRTVTAFADRYGGVGMAKASGAGRAIILPWGNFQVHGAGETSLVSTDTKLYPVHRGAHPMVTAWSTAIKTSAIAQLFDVRSPRVLAVLDWGDVGIFPEGSDEGMPPGTRQRRGVFIRAGMQFRPAHLVEGVTGGGPFSLGVLLRGAAAQGLAPAGPPDVRAIFSAAARRHARVQAQAMRYRFLHGALNTSNMELAGGVLDVEVSTTQPGTAPIMAMDFQKKFGFVSCMDQFGFEQYARSNELQVAYDAVRSQLSEEERKRLNAPEARIADELLPAYTEALELELLVAMGLRRDVAAAIRSELPALAARFREAFIALTRILAPGTRIVRPVPRELSVAKPFRILAELPKRERSAEELADIQTYAATGERAETLRLRARAWARELGAAWEAIAARAGPELKSHRAAFSNADPSSLEIDFLDAMVNFEVDAPPTPAQIGALLTLHREMVLSATRNVERVLHQGEHGLMPDGTVVTQRRVQLGAVFELRLGAQGDVLAVEVPLDETAPGVFRHPMLSKRDLVKSAELRGSVVLTPPDGATRWLDCPVELVDGTVRATLQLEPNAVGYAALWVTDAAGELVLSAGGYAFVLPDASERRRLETALRPA